MGSVKRFERLKTSKQFQVIYKKGRSAHSTSVVIFYLKTHDCNLGFTSSKKVGNAVKRNRARRRIKAIVNDFEAKLTEGSFVFVAKEKIHTRNHNQLVYEIKKSLKKLHVLQQESV